MRLVNARLCLDCEEVHEDQHCPICGSESFAFMTRWVTPSDTIGAETSQRQSQSQSRPPDPVARREPTERREQVDAYRQILNPNTQAPRRGRLVTGGAIGLALLGLARVVWRAAPERPDARSDIAEGDTLRPPKESR